MLICKKNMKKTNQTGLFILSLVVGVSGIMLMVSYDWRIGIGVFLFRYGEVIYRELKNK